jgi:hypothetical protein
MAGGKPQQQREGEVERESQGSSSEAVSKPSHSQGRRKSLRKGLFRKSMWTSAEASTTTITPETIVTDAQKMAASPAGEDQTTPRRFDYGEASFNSSSDSGLSQPMPHLRASPVAGTSSTAGSYASTTDEDEMPSFYRPPASGSISSYGAIPLQAQSPAVALQRRRSHRSGQLVSLAVVQTPADLALDDDWDYSETEWWGWVILLSTWLVFVVGMGSCLGVWSWAWDVGETPYAPPELEDDPTLPITGYYPALMVCTVVMAWIWVVVAWVGMKYFKHSKLTADDG